MKKFTFVAAAAAVVGFSLITSAVSGASETPGRSAGIAAKSGRHHVVQPRDTVGTFQSAIFMV